MGKIIISDNMIIVSDDIEKPIKVIFEKDKNAIELPSDIYMLVKEMIQQGIKVGAYTINDDKNNT